MTMPARCGLLLLAALAAGPAFAQPAPPSGADREARRFPQPVRVGDLVDRRVLEPKESQPVLGRVTGLVRGPDGAASVVVSLDRWFGLRGRSVAVPVTAVALLGEHVALVDLTPDQLRALPDIDTASLRGIPAEDTIRIGLARPFH